MYPQYWLNSSADHVISSLIQNTWSRIARIFGGTDNNVGNGPGSGDCDVSDNFRSTMPPACDTWGKLACDHVACDHRSSSLY